MTGKLRTLPIIFPVFVLLLSACGHDREVSEKDWQFERSVRESMQRTQVAAEHYAADHGTDQYPVKLDDVFKSYLPGGIEGSQPAVMGTINPFSGKNEFPTVNTSVKSLHDVRYGERIKLNPGEVLYCPLDEGKAYVVLGGGYDGKALPDEKNPGQVLVLSNLED